MVLECMYDMALNIPEDISVVSLDDSDCCRISYLPVTEVARTLKESGSLLVKNFMEIMNGRMKNNVPEKVVLKADFIVRKSGHVFFLILY
jgi:DNA-binding LacI/PurR family transcriptional regulator